MLISNKYNYSVLALLITDLSNHPVTPILKQKLEIIQRCLNRKVIYG